MKKKNFLCFSYYCFMQEEQEAKKFPNEINFIINEKKAEKTEIFFFPMFFRESTNRRTWIHNHNNIQNNNIKSCNMW